jgi:hypothetical protein
MEVQRGTVKFDIQTYVHDVIFISENRDRISQIAHVLDQYVQWSKIEVNASKCTITSYIYGKDRRWTSIDQSFMLKGDKISNLTIAESTRYLGARIAARRMVKLGSVKFKLEKMDILLGKSMS